MLKKKIKSENFIGSKSEMSNIAITIFVFFSPRVISFIIVESKISKGEETHFD